VVAIDGTIMSAADSTANLAVYSKHRGGRNGSSGYPQLRLLALVSCGTRTAIDAVFRPVSFGETTCTPLLLPSLRAGMLLLADRNFAAGFLARKITEAKADFLIRVRTGNSAPKLPVLRRLPDGSWLSLFGGVSVRVIDAEVTVATSAGQPRDGCRLVTTLTGNARYPAGDLAVLYHERWEVETAYLELKSTILGGRVLRARTPDRSEQEIYALLITYQALRTVIADAACTAPDRAGDRGRPGGVQAGDGRGRVRRHARVRHRQGGTLVRRRDHLGTACRPRDHDARRGH
jgi:Transposase DDE domain